MTDAASRQLPIPCGCRFPRNQLRQLRRIEAADRTFAWRVKEERLSPPPRRIKEERFSPPQGFVKEERRAPPLLLNAIMAKACDRILHYLGGGGFVVPLALESWYPLNAGYRSALAKTDVASEWVRNDPDLAVVWALDRSVTTAETAARRRHRLYDELA